MVRTKYKDFGWDSKMIYWGYLWEELIMEYNKRLFCIFAQCEYMELHSVNT